LGRSASNRPKVVARLVYSSLARGAFDGVGEAPVVVERQPRPVPGGEVFDGEEPGVVDVGAGSGPG
jgi:hypothetical protein